MAQQFCCNIDGVPLYSNLRFPPLVRKQGNMGLITQVGLCKCAITLAVEKPIAPRAVGFQAAAPSLGAFFPVAFQSPACARLSPALQLRVPGSRDPQYRPPPPPNSSNSTIKTISKSICYILRIQS